MRTPRVTPAPPLPLEEAALDQVTGGVAPASGSNPDGGTGVDTLHLDNFFAFDPNFRGGVFIAATDAEGDGAAEP